MLNNKEISDIKKKLFYNGKIIDELSKSISLIRDILDSNIRNITRLKFDTDTELEKIASKILLLEKYLKIEKVETQKYEEGLLVIKSKYSKYKKNKKK